ncbi:hypothetical protein LVJ94_21425 [Pendulispora rubella]|uniref:Outer membrane protein beta-barrel domain-containing protein n=1 Tax=Pendulispora rubella TaxID=2741070 RepID=A0ABZ2LIX2_9BACT
MLRACAVTVTMVIAHLLPASVHADEPAKDRAEPNEPQPKREIVWANTELGVQSLHLRTFEANPDAVTWGVLPGSAAGPTIGLGAGVRIVFATIGVRGRFSNFYADAPDRRGGFQLWTLDAELGFRAPLGRFEPYITLAGGYATFGGLSTAISGLERGLDVNGVNTRLALGLDYYATKNVSFGASLGGDLLFITRHGVSARDLATPQEVNTLNQAKARVLEASGSSVGAAWSATAGVGIHF